MRLTHHAGRYRLDPRLLAGVMLFALLALAPTAGVAEEGDLMSTVKEDPKSFKSLVEAGREYFDLDEQLWSGRKGFLAALEAAAGKGQYPLKDMDFLRWLVYQSRSFGPNMTDRKWQRANGIEDGKRLGPTMYSLKSEQLTITFSVPKSHPKKPKDFRKQHPRIDPYPLVLAMHEKRDYTNQKYPGQAAIQRLYPKKPWSKLFENWLVLVPVAAAGNFIDRNTGLVRASVLQQPFSIFWKHYHVDFDRVILDGSKQALKVAASQGVYFAGIVFRGKWKLETDAEKGIVRNFAPIPVYVVDNPELAKQLEEAGHENVTAGISGPILYKWMCEQRRKPPKKFKWTAQSHDQVLPYWVNLDAPKWGAPARNIEVEVVDTEKEPNTIKIRAVGVNDLSLFLNDDIVDLDKKVRVEINGHVEHDEVLVPPNERMKTVGRDLDVLFNREPVRIRSSMYFGWLTPARIVRLPVRPPAKKEEPKPTTPKDTGPKATPEEEEKAERYYQKAGVFEKKGNLERAAEWYQRVVDLPLNKFTADAQKKLEELKSK